MKKKHVKFLKRIVETPSPTGSEVAVADIVRERLLPIADEIHTDTMGSVHATYVGALHAEGAFAGALGEGVDAEDAAGFGTGAFGGASEGLLDEAGYHDPYFDDDDEDEEAFGVEAADAADALAGAASPLTLMLAAHMDEIGLMVTYISDDGFLSVAALGGVDAAILPGMRVDVHAEGGVLRGVVARKPIHLIDADERKSVTPLDKMAIDLGMPAKAVRKKVRVGDAITIAAGFERFGDAMAVSRAFDDKVGVFIACRVMEKLAASEDYAGNFVAAITVQEEIGTRGAMTSAHAVAPDVALAFDVTHATDYPGIDKAKHGDIVCGGGPVIARGPNINPVVFERLVKAAEDEGIPYQLEAEPSVTGTDARAIQVTRDGIPTGLVSIPLRYMHTPAEVVSLDDVSATVRLIARFAADLDEAADFVPGHAQDHASDALLEHGGAEEDFDLLAEEVARLSEDVADLQALAGIDANESADWIGLDVYGAAGYQAAPGGAEGAFAATAEDAAGYADGAFAEVGAEGYAEGAFPGAGAGFDAEGFAEAAFAGDDAEGAFEVGDDALEAGGAYADEGYARDGFAGDGFAGDGFADDGFEGDGFEDEGYEGDGYAFAEEVEVLPRNAQPAPASAAEAEAAIEPAPAPSSVPKASASAVRTAASASVATEAAADDGFDDEEDDDVPAAYVEGDTDGPALKLKLEGFLPEDDADDDYDEPGEERPEPHDANERTQAARSSLPIVMVSPGDLTDDE